MLVLGAGEMGEGMAVALAGAGVGRGRRGQPHHEAGPASWPIASVAAPSRCSTCPTSWPDVDVLLTSTGSQAPVLEAADVAAGHGGRGAAGRC